MERGLRMWVFWIGAGVLAAIAAALVVARATAAAAGAGDSAEDPSLAVYRRQLAELDDLAARGLLGETEKRAAYAEAGRRLLGAADKGTALERTAGPGARLAVMVGLGAAVLGALGLYVLLGSPGFPDQPYRARVAQWRANPQAIGAAEMAAVLHDMVRERPNDAQARAYLGRAELAAGDAPQAAADLQKAIALNPNDAVLYALLGEALLSGAEGTPPPEAEAAFRKSLAIDPKNVAARYLLARTQILRGEREAGLAGWKALQAEIPASDPRRAALDADMQKLTGGVDAKAAALAQSGAAPQNAQDQAAFIKAMVDRLAARLKAEPGDADGWARLVRAYKVFGDRAKQAEALDGARKALAGRPQDLARVEAEAR